MKRSTSHEKKKVEFSPSLASIDSNSPSMEWAPSRNHSATWDTETVLDHMLSYFLGGPSHGASRPMPQFAQAPASSGANMNGFAASMPPPTPATQFYSKRSSSRDKDISPGSISTIKESLVTGGALLNEHSNENGSPFDYTPSPISPAAIIGAGQETLLLPPENQTDRTYTRQQQHLEWLQAINAQAKRAAQQQKQEQVPIFPAQGINPFGPSVQSLSSSPPEETEEKRAKRLERNRESARKSRRRKKERLETLSKQVNNLYDTLEFERTQVLNDMVPGLMQRVRLEGIRECIEKGELSRIWRVLRNTGPTGTPAEAMIDYQYALLKQSLLPRYVRFSTWLMVQDAPFYASGKIDYANKENPKSKITKSTLRITSKQVGESIASEEKSDQLSAVSTDDSRMWPLVAYEVGYSLDQEEKIIDLHDKCKDSQDATQSRKQATAAVNTSESIRKAVGSLCRKASAREETYYGAILDPQQLLIIQDWKTKNRDRCVRIVQEQIVGNELHSFQDSNLYDICRQLKQVLQISDSS